MLNFVLEKGSCVNVDDESVIACADFTENKGKACHRFDGNNWASIASTLDNHHFGNMARHNNKERVDIKFVDDFNFKFNFKFILAFFTLSNRLS